MSNLKSTLMKNYLLLSFAVVVWFSAIAQNNSIPKSNHFPKIDSKLANIKTAYKKEEIFKDNNAPFSMINQVNKTVASDQMILNEDAVIGNTYYDLQTNASVGNRILNLSDGTISAVWTLGPTATFGVWDDRGTGYNYYNGTQWGSFPSARIENDRTGWPSVCVTSSGKEFVLAHNTNIQQLHLSSRSTKGTGSWTQSTTALTSPSTGGNLWGRMVSGGADGLSLHMISITTPTGGQLGGAIYKGQDGAITYSRSQDDGATWDTLHWVISDIDSSHYIGFGPDDYAIDAKGDTIAIVIGGNSVDVLLLKSTDNGTTWTKTIVNTFPISLYDGATMTSDVDGDGTPDTLESNDGSVAVLIDNLGKAHVWYGRMRVFCDQPGTGSGQGLSYFPYTDGLMYWNENMGSAAPVMIAGSLDLDGDGTINLPTAAQGSWAFGMYYGSMTSGPHAGIDANGSLYLSYSSVVENTNDGTDRAYRHVYVMRSDDGGTTWTNPMDVVGDLFTEGTFASIARRVDTKVHLIYQRDGNPGHSLSGNPQGTVDPNNKDQLNDIVYVVINAADLLTVGVKENNEASVKDLSLYPNPSSNQASIAFNISKPANIKTTIHNVVGQELGSMVNEFRMAGNYTININTSNYKPGVYFVNTTIGNKTFTQKMLVE